MKKFILHWYDGTIDKIEGSSMVDALTRAGYSLGSMSTLFWIEEVSE